MQTNTIRFEETPSLSLLSMTGQCLDDVRNAAVKRCYFAVEPRIVYTTRQLLPEAQKDVLPALH